MGTRREELQLVISAKDRSKSSLLRVARNIGGIVLAYKALTFGVNVLKESIAEATSFSATLLQVKRIAEVTGRSYNDVLEAMKTQTGGLATELTIATGFLKGLTTTLNVSQINQLTTAIRDASTAMGEDFNVQLPLIIKAIKQLNPAILDNIGVTVRLDRINKRIKDGYFGLSKEINETTQQHAIFTEIIRQTAQFQGAENVLLDTSLGLWRRMQTAITDAKKKFGEFLTEGEGGEKINEFLRQAIALIAGMEPAFKVAAEALLNWVKFLGSAFVDGGKILVAFGKLIKVVLIDPFRDTPSPARDYVTQLAAELQVGIEILKGFAGVALAALQFDIPGIAKAIQDAHDKVALFRKIAELLAMDVAKGMKDTIIPAWNEFAVVIEENGGRLVTTFGEAFNSTAEFIDALLEQIKNAFKELPKAAKTATDGVANEGKEAVKELSKFAKAVLAGLQSALEFGFESFSANLQANLFDTRSVLRETFKGMARDFISFFIDEAIKALAAIFIPKMLKLVTSIFDTPANDRAAMREGQRFAGFFIAGATGAFAGANLGAQIVQNAVGGGAPDVQAQDGTTIVFQNPITYSGFFRDARRELEDVSRRRPFQFNTRRISTLQTQAVRFS